MGTGAFDLIGRLELSVLLMEGLKPTDTVVDFTVVDTGEAAHFGQSICVLEPKSGEPSTAPGGLSEKAS